MIGKLFTQRFLLLLTLLTTLGSINAVAQTTVLTTSVPNGGYYDIATGGQRWNSIITEVQNDNMCPIALTNMSILHWGRVQLGFQTFSANDSSYNLYVSYTSLNGGATVNAPNGWIFVGNSGPITTDTFNQVTQIFKNLNVVIPANAKARFAVHSTGIMLQPTNVLPITHTGNNITWTSGGSSNVFSGVFPSLFNSQSNTILTPAPTPPILTFNFVGSLTFEQLAPTTPIADVSLKPAIRCIGQNLVLKATHPKQPNGVFTWKDKNGNIISQNTTGTHTITGVDQSHAGRYYVTYTLCGKESLPDSGTLIISDPPAPTVSGKFDYCLNEQFEYTVVNGTNPIWYYVQAPGGSPVPVTPTINTSSPNTLIYYVSQTDQYGCESRTRTMVRYRAAPKPEKPIVNTPVYYCEEMPAEQLTAIGDTLLWYYFPVGGVPTINAPTPNTSKNDSFQYYVTQTIDGCESDRSRIDVVVTFRPNGQILLDKEALCAQDSITIGYYGSAFVGSQYNWELPSKGTTILNGGFDQGPIVIRLDTPGTFKLKLTVGQTGCLSEEYEETITVNPLPYARIYSKQDVCLGQAELIEAIRYTPNLDTFNWDFDGGKTTHFATEQGPYGVYWDTDGEKVIKVTMVDEGCVYTEMDTIMVHPKPSATILATRDVYNNDQRLFTTVDYVEGEEMCASDSLKVTVQNVEPGASYKWTPTRFFDTYSDQPVTYARVDFSSKIYVEVEDVYGCQNKDSLDIKTKSCCEMTFPSAFSPNGDGRNDRFRPVTIGRREVGTFQVFNRYGQLVYESKQAQIGWDGTMNGKPADIGAYFYQIKFMCDKENVNQSGEVILVR